MVCVQRRLSLVPKEEIVHVPTQDRHRTIGGKKSQAAPFFCELKISELFGKALASSLSLIFRSLIILWLLFGQPRMLQVAGGTFLRYCHHKN